MRAGGRSSRPGPLPQPRTIWRRSTAMFSIQRSEFGSGDVREAIPHGVQYEVGVLEAALVLAASHVLVLVSVDTPRVVFVLDVERAAGDEQRRTAEAVGQHLL